MLAAAAVASTSSHPIMGTRRSQRAGWSRRMQPASAAPAAPVVAGGRGGGRVGSRWGRRSRGVTQGSAGGQEGAWGTQLQLRLWGHVEGGGTALLDRAGLEGVWGPAGAVGSSCCTSCACGGGGGGGSGALGQELDAADKAGRNRGWGSGAGAGERQCRAASVAAAAPQVGGMQPGRACGDAPLPPGPGPSPL